MNLEIAERFYKSIENWRRFHITEMKQCAYSKSELSMLIHIKSCQNKCDEVKTSDLTEQLNISKPAISQMLNVLEEKGLIERKTNSTDRRLTNVWITEEGNQILAKHMQQFMSYVGTVFEKMGQEDSERFVDLLDKFFLCVQEIKNENKSKLS